MADAQVSQLLTQIYNHIPPPLNTMLLHTISHHNELNPYQHWSGGRGGWLECVKIF